MKLNEYMREHSLSARNLAAELGVSVTALNRYRNGQRIPERSVMKKIMDLTGGSVTANSFYTE